MSSVTLPPLPVSVLPLASCAVTLTLNVALGSVLVTTLELLSTAATPNWEKRNAGVVHAGGGVLYVVVVDNANRWARDGDCLGAQGIQSDCESSLAAAQAGVAGQSRGAVAARKVDGASVMVGDGVELVIGHHN